MTAQRVVIPKDPSSVHYHRPGCGTIDMGRAAELARGDAEDLGYRAHGCVPRDHEPPDGGGRREVPA